MIQCFKDTKLTNMRQRTITAVFFAAAMIGGIYGGQLAFFLLFVVIALGSLWELNGLLLPKNEHLSGFRKVIGCLMGILPVLWIGGGIIFFGMSIDVNLTPETYIKIRQDQMYITAAETMIAEIVLLFLIFVFELFATSKSPFQNIGTYLLGVFYIGFPIASLCSLATHNAVDYHPHRVFGILWLIWTNDTMAYLIGSRIGKTKLFERISPNKTWEGTIGGGLCTVAMAGLISLYVKDFSQTQWLALGLVVAVFGNLGDLVESMLKRSVGVKDSGNLLPGHGGLLDRFDSFIFILPFAWLVLQVI